MVTWQRPQRSLLGVPLAGTAPLDRAWSLLARVQAWFGADEWRDVQRRARVLDTEERRAAIGRLSDAMARHRQSQAMRVLIGAARDAPESVSPPRGARSGSGPSGTTRPLSREARDETGRLLEQTVLAIVLSSEVSPDDVALVAVPVLSVVRDVCQKLDLTPRPSTSPSRR